MATVTEYEVYLMELGLSPEEMQARIAREFPREASQAGSVALREDSGSRRLGAPRIDRKLKDDVRAFLIREVGLSPEAATRRVNSALREFGAPRKEAKLLYDVPLTHEDARQPSQEAERRLAEALASMGYQQHKAALDGDSLPPESVELSEAERRTREALTRMGYGGHKEDEAGEAQAGTAATSRLDRALSELRAR